VKNLKGLVSGRRFGSAFGMSALWSSRLQGAAEKLEAAFSCFCGKRVGGLGREAGPTAREGDLKGEKPGGYGFPGLWKQRPTEYRFPEGANLRSRAAQIPSGARAGNGRGGSGLVTGTDLWEEQDPEGRSS
jgi:hypothetical protein